VPADHQRDVDCVDDGGSNATYRIRHGVAASASPATPMQFKQKRFA
jgi:hypothetical protein